MLSLNSNHTWNPIEWYYSLSLLMLDLRRLSLLCQFSHQHTAFQRWISCPCFSSCCSTWLKNLQQFQNLRVPNNRYTYIYALNRRALATRVKNKFSFVIFNRLMDYMTIYALKVDGLVHANTHQLLAIFQDQFNILAMHLAKLKKKKTNKLFLKQSACTESPSRSWNESKRCDHLKKKTPKTISIFRTKTILCVDYFNLFFLQRFYLRNKKNWTKFRKMEDQYKCQTFCQAVEWFDFTYKRLICIDFDFSRSLQTI